MHLHHQQDSKSEKKEWFTLRVIPHSAKYVTRTSFDVTTKPDVETTLVIGCIWKFPGRLFTSRRFNDVATTSFTSRCRHNVSTTFATSKDVRKTFIYNQIFKFFRRRVSTGGVLPSGTYVAIMHPLRYSVKSVILQSEGRSQVSSIIDTISHRFTKFFYHVQA